MTAPAEPQTELQALLEEHADLILAIEIAATVAVAASLADQLGQIQRDIAALWIRLVGALAGAPTPEQAQPVTSTLIKRLRKISVSVSDDIRTHAIQAAAAGREQALAEVGAPPVDGDDEPVLSPELEDLIDQVDAAVQDRIDTAITRLQDTPPETWDQVTDALSVANQARGTAERAAARAVNAASNEAIIAEAERLKGELVWVAERDACVSCLAYSGITAIAGASFPIGRTYGSKPVKPWPDPDFLPGPPLHPRCRCRLMIYFGHDTKAATAALAHVPGAWRTAHVGYPAALRREADRSILRGWSLPSESEGVRVRAAEKLLLAGVKAPQSVKDYARRAVRKGAFPSRSVPTPPP